jgi:hypothetical protein
MRLNEKSATRVNIAAARYFPRTVKGAHAPRSLAALEMLAIYSALPFLENHRHRRRRRRAKSRGAVSDIRFSISRFAFVELVDQFVADTASRALQVMRSATTDRRRPTD